MNARERERLQTTDYSTVVDKGMTSRTTVRLPTFIPIRSCS
jgi:hypothetical protein